MRAAMRALLPDFSRLSLKSSTGMVAERAASGSNDPREAWAAERQRSRERLARYDDPPLTYEEGYYVDWEGLSAAEQEAVIQLLIIQEEKKRGAARGATSTQKTAWYKGERYWKLKLSPELLDNFGKVDWFRLLRDEERIPWYFGDESGGNVCGIEAGQNSQGGQYPSGGVLHPYANWGPDHGGA